MYALLDLNTQSETIFDKIFDKCKGNHKINVVDLD